MIFFNGAKELLVSSEPSAVTEAGKQAQGLMDWIISAAVAIISFIVNTVGKLGYAGIVLLMGLESSFVPFPSEVIMAPAGYHVSQGQMNMVLVIICGITGSILGSLLNYWIAARFGRTFLLKYSRYFFLNHEKFAKFEKFFNTHGEITTFIGRLIPVVRQYISFPAGLVRMNMVKFILYTGLGAGIWVTILAFVGYFVGNNIEMVKQDVHKIGYVMFPVLALIAVVYTVLYKRKKKKTAEAVPEE